MINCYRELTRSRDLVALHILARVYRKPITPYVLNSLVKQLRLLTRSKTTVYYKCKKLHEMGLIELVRGNPCLIFPRDDVSGEVIWSLVVSADQRLGVACD